MRMLLCEDMLLRDTLLRTLLREDVAARYGAADAAVRGCCCAIKGSKIRFWTPTPYFLQYGAADAAV